MEPRELIIIALGLMAVGVGGWAVLMLRGQLGRERGVRYLDRMIAHADGSAGDPAFHPSQLSPAGAGEAPALPSRWLSGRLGQALVADEDRALIAQCGFAPQRTQLRFLMARAGLAVALPLAGWAMVSGGSGRTVYFVVACLFVAGFMGPKWALQAYAARRRERVAHELPIFVDMLGLLQSVGLSLDQSLQTLARDFRHVLPILGGEVEAANRTYFQGRTREHSLQRLTQLHDGQALADLVALLVQVDRHGGAIQQPLRQFAERLREQRKSEMKGAVGKIAVKMTVVMVTTLLPSLIIITAGPGFLAVIRALSGVAK
jgi:tight adherence protein C